MTNRERLNLLSGPAVEPVSEAEAMAHVRISGEEEIALLHGHIRAAREAVEAWTGRALISQSWRLSLDRWPPPSPRRRGASRGRIGVVGWSAPGRGDGRGGAVY